MNTTFGLRPLTSSRQLSRTSCQSSRMSYRLIRSRRCGSQGVKCDFKPGIKATVGHSIVRPELDQQVPTRGTDRGFLEPAAQLFLWTGISLPIVHQHCIIHTTICLLQFEHRERHLDAGTSRRGDEPRATLAVNIRPIFVPGTAEVARAAIQIDCCPIANWRSRD